MTNIPGVRSALAYAALGITPPMIRNALLEDSAFREEYGIEAEAVLSFAESGFSFPRLELHEAIREILAGASVKEVSDTNGKKWKVEVGNRSEGSPVIELICGEESLSLPHYGVLASDTAARLRSLDESADDVNLPISNREAWRCVLEARPLQDDEVDAFHSDLRDTPIERARAIRREMIVGQGSIQCLVPLSRRYYDRLVGAYDGSVSIHEYATRSGRKLLDKMIAWRPYDGLLLSLCLASHPSMTAEIDAETLPREDLLRALDFLDRQGDRTSQIGAIEIGLRVLPSLPEIQPSLASLVKQIRNDDTTGESSGFKLFSALFLFVDGELSRARVMASEPPFFRRFAALSQAALIHRELAGTSIDASKFYDWTFRSRGEAFYLQSVADLRSEPSWHPGLASGSEFKAHSVARIAGAATNSQTEAMGEELGEYVRECEAWISESLENWLCCNAPGPLEGSENRVPLPVAFADSIVDQLATEDVGPSSFVALVNSALVFQVGIEQAELAAKALEMCGHRLAQVDSRTQLLAVLSGLAKVAASARSEVLANELRVLVRRYMRDPKLSPSTEEAIRICLVSAASREDMSGWRAFVGEWLTELAFGDLDGESAMAFRSHLRFLCSTIPALWVTCGMADAALMARTALP